MPENWLSRQRARRLATPRHPYTVGLLRSVPRLDEPRKPHYPITDNPDLMHLPSGCAFAPVVSTPPRCQTEVPPLLPVAADHLSACWVAEEFGRESQR
jgi:oligopeptide/dipeptide ABC transporter ATP-binding protein